MSSSTPGRGRQVHQKDGYTPEWTGGISRKARDYLMRKIRDGEISGDCCLCGLEIDLSVPYPNRECLTTQHVVPRSVAPHLTDDPSNWAPAHMSCNQAAGDRLSSIPIGRRSKW